MKIFQHILFWLSAFFVFFFACAGVYLAKYGPGPSIEALLMGAFFLWRAYAHAKRIAAK